MKACRANLFDLQLVFFLFLLCRPDRTNCLQIVRQVQTHRDAAAGHVTAASLISALIKGSSAPFCFILEGETRFIRNFAD